ncbi:MAG: hypothetical protein KGO96_12735 [Elusimicrobia bacterium]|nr:hypothetical protein [Elusimicrobiota bacterium]
MTQKSLLDQKPPEYQIPQGAPDVVDAEFEATATTALTVPDHHDAMTAFAELGIGIDTAKQIAFRLNDIVEKQKLFADIQGKKHLLVEAWCTCAGMCGLSPRTVWCKRITTEAGNVLGYEARVEVVRLSTDQVVGAAEAECWMDEKLKNYPRWKEKHAAKSMAQTRGTSKAIAQILRWIPILAGYSGTPAEEADEDMGLPPKRPSPEANKSAATAQPRGERVTDAEVAGVVERWRKCVEPGTATKENWRTYVHSYAGREFDPSFSRNWNKADLDAVSNSLEMRGA